MGGHISLPEPDCHSQCDNADIELWPSFIIASTAIHLLPRVLRQDTIHYVLDPGRELAGTHRQAEILFQTTLRLRLRPSVDPYCCQGSYQTPNAQAPPHRFKTSQL